MVSKRGTVRHKISNERLIKLLNEGIEAGNIRREKERLENQTSVTEEVYGRLSPNRKQVIDTLNVMTDPTDNPWVMEVYAAVDEAFFEKAARIIKPHSSRLARKLLEG